MSKINDNLTTADAKHDIASAADDAIKTIATAANEAAKVVAIATAQAAKLAETTRAGDHDSIVELLVKVSDLQKSVNDISVRISSGYVSKDEFDPVKRIVYGLVGLILAAVVVALIALVINK